MDAFLRGLAALGTVAERAQIAAIAMVAEDALGDAGEVAALAAALLQRVGAADAPRKLPLLYALDHLSKRLGAEFQAAFAGSQTSMPMPGEVEGASAGPGLPGPTLSLTMQTSLAASGVAPVAVPPRMSASPFLKALTATTVVSASGLKFALSVSSQASGAALAGGGGVPVAIGRNALWLPLPPPQAVSRSAASAAGSIDGGFVFMGLHPGVCVQ